MCYVCVCVFSIDDIKRILTEEISRRGDTLLTFGDDVRFLCFRHVVKMIALWNLSESHSVSPLRFSETLSMLQ